MFINLSKDESLDLLKNNIYGHLGCHALGKTYVVPISYAFDGKYIYCHTHEGLKMDLMRRNAAVCFQVQEIDAVANWKSVIVQGNFQELEGDKRKKGLTALLDRSVPAVVTETVKITPDWPFTDPSQIDIPGIVFSISIDEISGRYEEAPVQRK